MKAQSLRKTEIDRLGDRLRVQETEDDLRMLDAYRFSFAHAYGQVFEKSKSVSSTEVTGRPAKSTAAIIEKLHRESIRLSQMQDIAGCRVLVTDVKAQNALVAQLAAAFNDSVVVDRREKPSHGYRAVHLVVTIEQRVVEIQIRTALQQFWALLSEKVADKFGNAIKYGLLKLNSVHCHDASPWLDAPIIGTSVAHHMSRCAENCTQLRQVTNQDRFS